jgi:hypothetical protein
MLFPTTFSRVYELHLDGAFILTDSKESRFQIFPSHNSTKKASSSDASNFFMADFQGRQKQNNIYPKNIMNRFNLLLYNGFK